MIGAIFRANSLPEISDETLMLSAIAEVASGEAHFLGHPETYARMRSDFLYPQVADRAPIEHWKTSDRASMAQRAAQCASEHLSHHWPNHLADSVRENLTERFGLERPNEERS